MLQFPKFRKTGAFDRMKFRLLLNETREIEDFSFKVPTTPPHFSLKYSHCALWVGELR